jgi:hypothetical protein
VGDLSPILRADYEDAITQALEDTLYDGKLDAFRSFLYKYRSEWPIRIYELCLSQDSWCWYTVYYLTCTLRRMSPRWEHCANKLKDQFGMSPDEIPQGQEWLHK